MTKQLTSISAHLCHAGEIIDAIAEATVKATPDAPTVLAHIDAAQSFVTAADALYEAAERVALGQPVDTPELLFALRVAGVKAAEGIDLLAGKPVAGNVTVFPITGTH
ncbi:hypothetical protein EEB11_00225 [Pseudotabrizicola sediminis]|uniref:Uncharacterized protein n=1 Tax=Pseudotabrizicola sediminis TaxID=2486418 RepID=A0ABY2KQN3_9RHOB|nr:hypothetical protein [Pseudotabrizicola sediminis]TGD45050.1 hypothetical protein EEB11_00225 [Pseudotabrizicola sediminis]